MRIGFRQGVRHHGVVFNYGCEGQYKQGLVVFVMGKRLLYLAEFCDQGLLVLRRACALNHYNGGGELGQELAHLLFRVGGVGLPAGIEYTLDYLSIKRGINAGQTLRSRGFSLQKADQGAKELLFLARLAWHVPHHLRKGSDKLRALLGVTSLYRGNYRCGQGFEECPKCGTCYDTGSGNCTVAGVRGTLLDIDTGSGDADATDVQVDRARFDTGSGNVKARSLQARNGVVDTGSGDAELAFAGGTIEDWRIDTGSGDVDLTLPPQAGVRLSLDTGSGDLTIVRRDVMLERRQGDTQVLRVGDGRGAIRVDTGSGDLTLR